MDTRAEGQMVLHIRPVRPEFVGIRETARIPVGRADQRQDVGAGRDRGAAQFGFGDRHPQQCLRRSVEAQGFGDHGGAG